jgi:hypothetical protein
MTTTLACSGKAAMNVSSCKLFLLTGAECMPCSRQTK